MKKGLKTGHFPEQPGKYPYTRGIHKNMYAGRLWSMRQYAGFASAEESNKRFKHLLAKGVSGLSVAFDLPTQMGLDPDNKLAKGEVGRSGVSIATVNDLAELFKGIALDKVSVSMTINSTAAILLAFYILLSEKQGIDRKVLRGTLQNDILKEHIARGTNFLSVAAGLRLTTDIIEYCADKLPKFNPISISGYHIREAGSTAVQELSFTFANAIEYVDLLLERGVKFDSFAPRLSFFFNCHSDFFEEIAKFRAARRIWAKIAKGYYRSKVAESQKLRFHTQTAGSTLTASQPLNNILRSGFEALAAVLGGTQSLHVNAYDEALALPSEKSAELALRTQQIIAFETGICNYADPLGGSLLLENLTDKIESAVWNELKKIKKIGGMKAAIEEYWPQKEIEKSAFAFQREIEKKQRLIVGVNCFEDSDPKLKIQLHKGSIENEKRQIYKIKKFKAGRNLDVIRKVKNDLEKVAGSNKNLIPYIIKAAGAGLTLGEISTALAEVNSNGIN